MPLPLTVSCFSKVQIGFTFLVPAYPGSPGQRAVKRVCVCVCCCYIVMSVFACLSARVSHEPHIQTSRYYLCVLRGSLRRCGALFAFGFVDDVMFARNQPGTGDKKSVCLN